MTPILIIEGMTGDIEVDLHRDGMPADLTGSTVEAAMKDGQGNAVAQPGTVTVANPTAGKVKFNPHANLPHGSYKMRFRVTDTNGKVYFFPSIPDPICIEVNR